MAGDACDACRFDPDDDQDADGSCGDVDNCPDLPNPDQGDADDDGIGDACDPTPAACSDGADNDDDGVTDYPGDSGCASDLDNSEDSPPPPVGCVTCNETLALNGAAVLKIKKLGKRSAAVTLDVDLDSNTWAGVDDDGNHFAGSFTADKASRKLVPRLDSASLATLRGVVESWIEVETGVDAEVSSLIPASVKLVHNPSRTTAKLKAKFSVGAIVFGVARKGTYTLSLTGAVVDQAEP
jgi:hypothetical protein